MEDGWNKTPQFPFEGKIQIFDLLGFLAQNQWVDKFKEKVVKPLKDLKAVCYYGCQVARPPAITGSKAPENPMEMEKIVEACGAEPLDWSHKTDCCGGLPLHPQAGHRLSPGGRYIRPCPGDRGSGHYRLLPDVPGQPGHVSEGDLGRKRPGLFHSHNLFHPN